MSGPMSSPEKVHANAGNGDVDDDEDDVDDVDIFLCEEISHEHEVYCYIYSDSVRKEFYYDESEDWVYKQLE